jgi:hypothetical protein
LPARTEPIIAASNPDDEDPFAAVLRGQPYVIREWRGSGPAVLHVHDADDEAWQVLEGVLRFRFVDRLVDVPAGSMVLVPAGVPHSYEAISARYRVALTPRLEALIAELQRTRDAAAQRDIYTKYRSRVLD